MTYNIIHNENCLAGLKKLPDNSIDCCVTSPPYYGQRDYGTARWEGGDANCTHKRDNKNNNPDFVIQTRGKVDNGVGNEIFRTQCKKCGSVRIDDQIGLEETPQEYVDKIVQVFEEVRRVLKKNGTLWIVLGDTYAAYYGDKYGKANSFSRSRDNTGQAPPSKKSFDFKNSNIKPKDLIGIPWMIAFSLRDAGWYLRQDIIWSKSNPMPESVTDRCTKSHEYIFLMSKSPKYYYGQDAIRQPLKEQSVARLEQDIAAQEGSDRVPGKTNGKMKAVGSVNGMANKKSVWTVSTKPFKEAHFATFPEDLIVDCIKAGCPPGGTILDPFMGAGTTALVAAKLNRHYIGFELNAKYIKICNKRLAAELGMFNPQPV